MRQKREFYSLEGCVVGLFLVILHDGFYASTIAGITIGNGRITETKNGEGTLLGSAQ